MTRAEAKKIMQLIRAAYPTFYKNKAEDEVAQAWDLWAMALENIEFEKAKKGFIEYARQNRFAPSVAEVVECARLQDDYLRLFFKRQI